MRDLSELTDINAVADEVANLAKDAVYVTVGLGVLAFQRLQSRRVDLSQRLAQDTAFETRLEDLRAQVSRQARQLDELVENVANFIETTLEPIEEQLPAPARDLAQKAKVQAREVRSQIRGVVVPAA
jgi:chaperonin cofactor prefoldin